MIQIAIFASGNGTNAAKIIEHFKGQKDVEFVVLSNNPSAPVLERAKRLGVEVAVFDRKELYQSDVVLNFLKTKEIDLIILSGFLWLIPKRFVAHFPNQIINIHPSLLPKYGGKGMYGDHVHKAVIANGEKESGITIHYVNEHYDEGEYIFQASTPVTEEDTYESLAQKIHTLEHQYFPVVVEQLVDKIRKTHKVNEYKKKEIESN